MDKKELDYKAFDVRKHDVYKYFLILFADYDSSGDSFEFKYDFTSLETDNIKSIIPEPNEFRNWKEIDRICYLTNETYNMLNFGCKEPIYVHGMSPLNVIHYAKTNNIRLNCINHAIIFNAILLSYSIYSRCVWCMPMDIANLEYHVVNVAYITEIKKWIFIDVSRNIICFKGECPLSPLEVRSALINDEEIELKYCSGVGHREIINLFYKIYLTKNMFRFGCFSTSSMYQNNEKYRMFNILNPKKYYPFSGRRRIFIGRNTFQIAYSSNDEEFWKAPS